MYSIVYKVQTPTPIHLTEPYAESGGVLAETLVSVENVKLGDMERKLLDGNVS